MVRWNAQNFIDTACHPDITVPEIADHLGFSISYTEKKLREYRDEIAAARESVQISDDLLIAVLDMWGAGYGNNEIAIATGLSAEAVRRLVLIAEIDETSAGTGADAELAALRAAHPDRLYEDDIRALTECTFGQPRGLSGIDDYVQPLGSDVARYKALPAPDKRRKITLPGSAVAA